MPSEFEQFRALKQDAQQRSDDIVEYLKTSSYGSNPHLVPGLRPEDLRADIEKILWEIALARKKQGQDHG